MTIAQRAPGWWRRLIPATGLGRVRLAALAYAVLSLLAWSLQLDRVNLSTTQLALGIVGFAWLLGTFVVTFLRRGVSRVEPVLTAGAVFLAGTSLQSPFSTIALAQMAIINQSLYGSTTIAIARLAAIIAARVLVVEFSPASAATGATWHSSRTLGNLPALVLIAVLMRALYSTLVQLERTAVRDGLLVDAATSLLNTTDVDKVRAVSGETAAALCRTSPGVGAMLLSVDPRTARVVGAAELPNIKVGDELPATWFTGAQSLAGASQGDRGFSIPELDPIVGVRRWRSSRIQSDGGSWLLLVGGERAVSTAVVDAFRNLATQRAQAELRCRADRELAYQARHDPLTSLANRAEFLRELNASIAQSRTGRDVAVLMIDLDNFKRVNDTYGHAVGDELLATIGARLRDVLRDTGLAARLGGDEFAVLIAAPDAAEVAPAIARSLPDALQQPVQLHEAMLSPRASIGLVVGEPDLNADELMRRADLAMYRAKTRGQDRIEQHASGNRR